MQKQRKPTIKSLLLSASVIALGISAPSFTAYAATCTGSQSRTVECRNHLGVTIGEDICNAFTTRIGERPDTTPQTCTYYCPPPPPPPSRGGDGGGGGGGDGDGDGSTGGGFADTNGDGRGDTYSGSVGAGSYSSSSSRGGSATGHTSVSSSGNVSGTHSGGATHSNQSAGGGGGDGDGDGSVLCGHFYQQNAFSYNVYRGDLEFANEQIDEATKRGYRLWAVPLTRHLNENPSGLVEKFVQPFVVGWAQEMAYRSGYLDKGNWLGKVQLTVAKPIVNFIGLFVKDTAWSHLSSEQAIGTQKHNFQSDPTAMINA